MASKIDKIHVLNDKRKKLTDEDKQLIIKMHDEGWSIRKLAEKFDVSKRLIQFILRPELIQHSQELRRKRLILDPHRYYDKDKHRICMADLRARKRAENIEIYTKKCPVCGKVFVAPRSDRVYCSKKCSWTEGNRRKKEKYGTM